MESGGGSNNQDGRGSRTPPDEQQMRIGRSRVARGFDPLVDENATAAPGASSELIGARPGDDAPFTPANRLPAEGAADSDSTDVGSRFGSWSDKGQPGTVPPRCHFLRSVGTDGRLTDPQKTAVPTHRCAAYGDPLPLSLRQQELVCLQRVHVSCPRYVRGTLLANENQVQPEPKERLAGGVPLLTLAGVGLVVVALLVLGGGFLGIGPLAGGSASHPPVVVASATASPSHVPTASPSATPTASSSATATASPTTPPSTPPSTPPTATPTAKPTATPRASASWPPGATASRMDLLVPCTGKTNCYVYTVRGPGPAPSGNGAKVGDTLSGIEWFFGVTDAQVKALNPSMRLPIRPGDKVKIPTPTRWNS